MATRVDVDEIGRVEGVKPAAHPSRDLRAAYLADLAVQALIDEALLTPNQVWWTCAVQEHTTISIWRAC